VFVQGSLGIETKESTLR